MDGDKYPKSFVEPIDMFVGCGGVTGKPEVNFPIADHPRGDLIQHCECLWRFCNSYGLIPHLSSHASIQTP